MLWTKCRRAAQADRQDVRRGGPAASPHEQALAFRRVYSTDEFIRPQAVRTELHNVAMTTALCLGPGRLLVGINIDEMPRMAVSQHTPTEHPTFIAWVGWQVLRQAADAHVCTPIN